MIPIFINNDQKLYPHIIYGRTEIKGTCWTVNLGFPGEEGKQLGIKEDK